MDTSTLRREPVIDTAIRTSGLTKRYGATLALDDLDLTVPAGTVMGYLGPNGAGKTTTMRLFTGALRPTSGSATVLGLDVVDDRRELRSRIGYLPADFVAPPDLTPRQYLGHLGALRGLREAGDAWMLAERFELDLDRRIGALSHGNRQKVGLVQAFLHRPDVLILDEPTAGLDPLMQERFGDLVRATRAAGRTLLVSSHVLSEVETLADEVALLRGGRLVEQQPVDVLRARALRRFRVTFAGPPPLATLRGTSGVRAATLDASSVDLVVEGSPAAVIAELGRHEVVDLVARPADLEEIFRTYYVTAR